MSDRNPTDLLNVRLPLYAYTAPLWRERRVLELGCGEGASAAFLARHGAADVVSLDIDRAKIDRARTRHAGPGVQFMLLEDLQQLTVMARRFDVVFVPDGESILGDPDAVPRVRGLLREGGFLVVAVPASERQSAVFRGGVNYYDLSDALAREFRVVRMLGQTPFLGFGLVEFDATADALRVDASLLGGGTEQPSHYIAVAGNEPPPVLGQVLVQVPFAPIEALAEVVAAGRAAEIAPAARLAATLASDREIARLKAELAEKQVASPDLVVEPGSAAIRADLAERRLEEIERRARARADEADARIAELRRKLEDALVQSESSVRVARAQAEEIEELRARLRRAAEDRSLGDIELGKLRRALAEADDSVLTLTRRTAEEMAVVAQRLATGLGSPGPGAAAATSAPPPPPSMSTSAELEAKLRRAEEAAERGEAEVATLTERLRVASEQARALKQQAGEIGQRDDRIARLEGDKQDLLWRVAEMEEKLRQAEQDAARDAAARDSRVMREAATTREASTQPKLDEVARARAARDRAIEEFHRAGAAHVTEVNRLQAAVEEHAALVSELEDALRLSEARAAAADKEAIALRRNAKELEEADRARRGRLSELEGKLLRIEREKATATARGEGVDPALIVEMSAKLQAAEQRAAVAEEQAHGSVHRAAAAEARMFAAEQRAGAAEQRAAANGAKNGARANGVPPDEIRLVIEDAEARLRDEVRTLGQLEQTLGRAEAFMAQSPSASDRAEWERTVAGKDFQIVETRLELSRVKREADAARLHLEREISDLRAKLSPNGAAPGERADLNLSGQLILMHSTLGNIRRRAARLRDELEGFRRRLDTLPPGALSSMLEEIGEDLGEFAK